MIKVSINGRYFTENGKPYFLLADTAWTLFQRLDVSETKTYLRNRKEKGFNTVYSVLINGAALDLLHSRDVTDMIAGDCKAYWDKISQAVMMAEKLSLHMGILPVWGDIVKQQILRADNLYQYLDFLTRTFGSFKNIFWILGGDIRGDNEYDLWNKAGTYLKSKMPEHIVGYHPFGRTSSSYWFHEQKWLDFNMFQSGHRRNDQRNLNAWDDRESNEPWHGEENFRYVQADYEKNPTKPVLDGEPSYEQIPQGLHNPEEPYWLDHHVRRYAYWSALSGAAGHVYGHNSVMQFYKYGIEPAYGAKETWEISIHDAGSSQMKFLKELMESIGFASGNPMQHKVNVRAESTDDNLVAFGTEDQCICYSYSGRRIELSDMYGLYEYYWFDPVSGVKSYAGILQASGAIELMPPNKKNGWNDWVLILKKAAEFGTDPCCFDIISEV